MSEHTDEHSTAPGPDTPFARVVVVPLTGSTSTDLVAAARTDPDAWPHLSVLRAEHQDAGRGRAGRTWETPPGEALTTSVLLRPRRPQHEWASLTVVAALALVRTLRAHGGADGSPLDAAIKWPNDVVLRVAGAEELDGWGSARKVAGLLAEVVPPRPGEVAQAVVLGVGVNVRQRELPVPWATSLAREGVVTSPAALLADYGVQLRTALAAWEDGGLAVLHGEVLAASDTIGRDVRWTGEDGRERRGRATGLDVVGHLVVDTATGTRTLTAGDVTHVRRT